MKIFLIRDLKSGAVDHPCFYKTVADAIRSFELALRDEKSILSAYREDFELLCVGELCMNYTCDDADTCLDPYLQSDGDPYVVAAGRDYDQSVIKPNKD